MPFDPRFSGALPAGARAGQPTGFAFDLSLPQSDDPDLIGEGDLRKAVVTLPQGVRVSPASADGLGACSDDQLNLGTDRAATCPDASKIGAVTLRTPLLEDPLEGSVFLRTQASDNPESGEMFRLAIEIGSDEHGIDVKLPGAIRVDPNTGQISAVVDNAPQLPFSTMRLSFFGGSRAPLTTPRDCGSYTTRATFTSWSGKTVESDSTFTVSGDGHGGPCPAIGFAPSFAAGVVNPVAGAFAPFVTSISREDTDQEISRIDQTLPAGVSAMLSRVPLCDEAHANAGSCSAASKVGHVITTAGAGSNPLEIPQKGQPQAPVYLTGPYKGAPFGLSVVVPAIAGPFDLGLVVVRAKVEVNPHTAQVSVKSDPLPTILQGIPLQVRLVEVIVDRGGFVFNPTNCNPMAVTGTVTSTEGTSVPVSSRFQVGDCASLRFAPRFSVSTQAKTSKRIGASLHVVVRSGSGQANIAKVHVVLPKALPSRLATLNHACPEAQFNSNPASCPQTAVVGRAKAITPILPVPLEGPAYFVSHGGQAFPVLAIVLQGYGVTIQLEGSTVIKNGITSATFGSVPDAPITRFDLTLPQGPNSALAANGNLCRAALKMPTTITGQNGAVTGQSTKIAVAGCPRKHGAKRHPGKRK